jgi:hypothetical protein
VVAPAPSSRYQPSSAKKVQMFGSGRGGDREPPARGGDRFPLAKRPQDRHASRRGERTGEANELIHTFRSRTKHPSPRATRSRRSCDPRLFIFKTLARAHTGHRSGFRDSQTSMVHPVQVGGVGVGAGSGYAWAAWGGTRRTRPTTAGSPGGSSGGRGERLGCGGSTRLPVGSRSNGSRGAVTEEESRSPVLQEAMWWTPCPRSPVVIVRCQRCLHPRSVRPSLDCWGPPAKKAPTPPGA